MRTRPLSYAFIILSFIFSCLISENCQAQLLGNRCFFPRRQVRQCRRQHADNLSHTISQIDSLPLHIDATWDHLSFSTDFARLLTILQNSPSLGIPNINASEGLMTNLPSNIARITLDGDHVTIKFKQQVQLVLDMPASKLPVKAEHLLLGENGVALEFDIVISKENPKLVKFSNVTGAKILLEKGKTTIPHELKFDDSGEKFKAMIVVDNPMPRPRGLAGIAWPKIVPVPLHLKPEELKMIQSFLPRIIHIYQELRIALHTGDLMRLMALMPEMRLRHKLQMLGVLRHHRCTINTRF